VGEIEVKNMITEIGRVAQGGRGIVGGNELKLDGGYSKLALENET